MMENTIPTCKYNGVEITYDEARNRWCFTIDGRDRSAETLTNARKAIDSAVSEKKAPFKPFEAYLINSWRSSFEIVKVTGIADSDSRTREFWVKTKDGRRKVGEGELREKSSANEIVKLKVETINSRIDAELKRKEELWKKLTPIKPE